MDINMNPKVSIIIPTYNGEKYIQRAIESVLAQSFSDWELIIVDDGSKDNTEKIISDYSKNEKIKYIYQENRGQASARNKGISIALGFYIAFLDDDDEWIDKDKLKKQVEFLDKNPEYILVGTGGIIVDEYSNKIMDYLVPETDELIRKNILLKNPFIQSSVVIRKDVLIKIGSFLLNEIPNAEDYNLWLRIGLRDKFFNLVEPMVAYMFRQGNISSNYKKDILKSNIRFIKEYKDKYPNYNKALFFAYLKFYTYSLLALIKNKKIKNKIINFLFKKYRNF